MHYLRQTHLLPGALGCFGAWIVKALVERGDVPVVFDLGEDRRRIHDLVAAAELEKVRFVRGDITDRERAEEALRESERRFRAVVDNVSVVCFTVDRAGIVTFADGKGMKKLGYEPGQRVGRSGFETYRDHPEAVGTCRRALAGEEGTFAWESAGLGF